MERPLDEESLPFDSRSSRSPLNSRESSQKLVKTRKWNTHFYSKIFQLEKKTAFINFQLHPRIFRWKVQKVCFSLSQNGISGVS